MRLKILNTPWPALLWTIVIFILLVIPLRSVNEGHFIQIPHFDKYVHAFMFGFFVWLWSRRFLSKLSTDEVRKKALWIFLISCLYGAGMEFYQEYFTEREFDLGDIIADVAGSAIAYLVFRLYFLKKSKPL